MPQLMYNPHAVVVSSLEACSKAGLGCRFSAVVSGGKFKSVNVEPDGTGLSCSTSSTIISQLKE